MRTADYAGRRCGSGGSRDHGGRLTFARFAYPASWASRVFSSRRMILPVEVFGRSGTNCTARGTL